MQNLGVSTRPQLVVNYVGSVPTPTSTPTNTPVPTATPTNTPIPTATPTDTPIPTATPTNTPTPTPTLTPTPTFTPTPTPTSTTVTLTPSNDSYVDENSPNNNYGADNSLLVASRNSNRNRRSFVQFNVAGAGIPSGATVISATLRLYLSSAPNQSRSYDAFRVTATWTESGITWSNQPGVAASATNTQPITAGWVPWDVTTDVQSFVNGASSNYGWRISDQTESASSTNRQGTFSSKEGTNAPQLVLVYRP
ncbi:MAG: DNRLRE domain-containing protein [Dehalococcoidia bacterium]|nr:DNRLRE domain-containing protein [Dehalococcoidia bacterium]